MSSDNGNNGSKNGNTHHGPRNVPVIFLIILSFLWGASLSVVGRHGYLLWETPPAAATVVSRGDMYQNNKNGSENDEFSLSSSLSAMTEPDKDRLDSSSGLTFRCMSLNKTLPDWLHESRQTFMVGSAKSGGSSLKSFVNSCMNSTADNAMPEVDNILEEEESWHSFLTNHLEVPRLVASHLYSGRRLVELIQRSTLQTKILMTYRSEYERLVSAVAFVINMRLCGPVEKPKVLPIRYRKDAQLLNAIRNEDSCTLDEGPILEHFVKDFVEVHLGNPLILTCAVWEALREDGNDILFYDYRRLDEVQTKISAEYCPSHQSEHANAFKMEKKVLIRTRRDGNVDLKKWVESKAHAFEFWLKLDNGGCRKEIRNLESMLETCPDGVVTVAGTK